MMKDRILGLPRNVFFLGLTSFFNDFSSEMVASVFPAFFISVLKAGAESLGLVDGVAEAASNLIKVYSGRWSDRIEKRKVFAIVGYTLSVFTRPFYVFAGSVGAVIGLRLMDRIGKGRRRSTVTGSRVRQRSSSSTMHQHWHRCGPAATSAAIFPPTHAAS